MIKIKGIFKFSYSLVFFACLGISPELAAEQTEWKTGDHARTRLITSHQAFGEGDTPLYLGWEIELEEGWKTYWRSPGDAGLPTTFDFQGSTNIGNWEVFHPVPERFELFGIQTFGYENHLILPILIEPEMLGNPINIKVAANFMVCKDICILLDETYSLSVNWSETGAEEGKYLVPITESVRNVPTTKETFLDKISLTSISVKGIPGHQNLIVDIKGYHHLAGADVIIEADNDFHFERPRKILKGNGKQARFIIPVGNMDFEENKPNFIGETIKVTIADGWGNAIEREVNITN